MFDDQQSIIRIGISQFHSNLHELNTAFQETSLAFDMLPISSTTSTFQYYDCSYVPHKPIWCMQDEFLFRIEAGTTKEVKALINSLFQWFLTLTDCTLGDAKMFCDDLATQCRFIMKQYINNIRVNLDSSSMRNVLTYIFSLNDLEIYYSQFFININTFIKPYSVYAIDNITEKIQIYIQRNYSKAITQDFIASLFYLNRSYLSTLFRKQTGEKFIDFLNHIRIEKAKEQLLHSNRKTYQIAKAVGYDNVKYFFRIFKKMTGMTPEQYRKDNL